MSYDNKHYEVFLHPNIGGDAPQNCGGGISRTSFYVRRSQIMIPLDEYLASKSPEFRKEVDKQYSEMAMEYSLSRLREELQMSQKELANNLNISQPAVCKIEKNAEDVKLSTLIKYVNALGGHLSLQVILPSGKGVVIPLPISP